MDFILKGTDTATGRVVDEQIQAPDQAAATEAARQRGIVFTELSPVPNPAPMPLDYETAATMEPFPLKSRATIVRILLGTEALLLLASVTWLFSESGSDDDSLRYGSVIVATAFLILQMGILAPVLRPRPAGGPAKSPWYWLSAIALGLVLGILVAAAIFFAADYYWATHEEFADADRYRACIVALYIALASWLISVPLIMAFMKRRRPESFLARFAATLFLGSIVEVIAGIPIFELARRRDSCTCGLASFWAILLATLVATIVLGPMVFLIILSRRTRAASRGFCAACGLDLRPLVQRDPCPRCGAGWKSL